MKYVVTVGANYAITADWLVTAAYRDKRLFKFYLLNSL